jgi:uncharacterized protein YodC (DUF2158 family)
MKHDHIPDTILQAAVDAACKELAKSHPSIGGSIALMSEANQSTRLHLARALLDNLPDPVPPVVDGNQSLDAAIARMEAVPDGELVKVYWNGAGAIRSEDACNRVRARLIAAAKEGQAVPSPDYKLAYERAVDDVVIWRDRAEKAEADLKNAHQTANNYHRQSLESESRATVNLRKLEKAEAELARVRHIYDERVIEMESKPSLSQLRPISEAGPVPDGCVRVTGFKSDIGRGWCLGEFPSDKDTHCADLRLPAEPSQASQPWAEKACQALAEHAQQTNKPTEEIPWTEWRGGPCPLKDEEVKEFQIKWSYGTVHTYDIPPSTLYGWDETNQKHYAEAYRVLRWKKKPKPEVKPWTPAVGDVVVLMSGSPEMTITHLSSELQCQWFKGADRYSHPFPAAALKPAPKEEQL